MTVLRTALLLFLLLSGGFSYANYDSTEFVVIQAIRITGNKKTKDPVIFRELTFLAGDRLTRAGLNSAINESERNLLILPLFHFVNTTIENGDLPGTVRIVISFTERWYTWLWPVFEISDRNFNVWLENGNFKRLSYGLFFQQENFRGRLEKLHIRLKLGYQQQIALLYEAPYLNHRKTIGAGLTISAARQREVGYITIDDKLQFYQGDDFMLQELDLALFARYRPGIHFSHTLQLRFNRLNLNDSLLVLNPEYISKPGSDPHFTEFSYLVKADYRDQRAYPLKGWYGDAEFARFGLAKGDQVDFFTFRTNLRAYVPLADRWFAAFSVAARFTAGGNVPYYLNRALGYKRDYVRGYEYYVIEGRQFMLFKSDLKFALVQPAIKKIEWIRSDKFNTVPYSVYLGAFADYGRAWPGEDVAVNSLQGKNLLGFGLGVDFITYYDKVVRVEFSLNGKGETGVFLHFMAAI